MRLRYTAVQLGMGMTSVMTYEACDEARLLARRSRRGRRLWGKFILDGVCSSSGVGKRHEGEVKGHARKVFEDTADRCGSDNDCPRTMDRRGKKRTCGSGEDRMCITGFQAW